MSNITYRKGTDKKDRAAFVCGKASIPSVMITRLLNELEGKSESAIMRTFFKKLSGRHDSFLDALDKAGLDYKAAIQALKDAAPAKRAEGKPRIGKEASAVARILCRKYAKKSPDEMLAAFLETAGQAEFKSMVVELINKSLETHGRNAQGKIRVRGERQGAGTKALVERMGKAREAKKAKG